METALKDLVKKFREFNNKVIRIIGHLDSDGLSAVSILIKSFKRENIKFVVSIIKQLDENLLKELKNEEYNIIFFVDIGSSFLSFIEKYLSDKIVFVLDHHKPENFNTDKIIHFNPHLYDIDGARDISGAGVVYLFAKELNQKNIDLAHLAVIGAIGDMQEYKGFSGINKTILEDAIKSKKITIKNGLRMFGLQTRPIHKVLEYSTDPYIPGVTGNEKGAIQFLSEIGINIKEGGKYKKLIHLNQEDVKKLVTGIILKRLGSESNPEDVLGNIYLLNDEIEESATKDAREFSTLLNACGRLDKPSVGIGTCLGNSKLKEKSIDLLFQYKTELITALNWFYKNRNTNKILERKGYIIINSEDNIRSTLVGTLASIISKSNTYDDGTIIVSLAHTLEGNTKISFRVSGFRESDIDLREIVKEILKFVGGIGGGHRLAAGALIAQEREEEFLKITERVLDKFIIEENIK